MELWLYTVSIVFLLQIEVKRALRFAVIGRSLFATLPIFGLVTFLFQGTVVLLEEVRLEVGHRSQVRDVLSIVRNVMFLQNASTNPFQEIYGSLPTL